MTISEPLGYTCGSWERHTEQRKLKTAFANKQNYCLSETWIYHDVSPPQGQMLRQQLPERAVVEESLSGTDADHCLSYPYGQARRGGRDAWKRKSQQRANNRI